MKRSPNGFTLIEVVIAIFVVAFALVAIMEVFNVDVRSSQNAREQLQAAARAQMLMEGVARTLPPRSSIPPEIIVEHTGTSERVTVNVSWQKRDSAGSVVITREFFL